MKKLISPIGVLIGTVLAFSSGCVTHNLDYSTRKAASTQVEQSFTIDVQPFKYSVGLGPNQLRANIFLTKNVADVFQQALEIELKNAGYKIGESDIQLTGDIKELINGPPKVIYSLKNNRDESNYEKSVESAARVVAVLDLESMYANIRDVITDYIDDPEFYQTVCNEIYKNDPSRKPPQKLIKKAQSTPTPKVIGKTESSIKSPTRTFVLIVGINDYADKTIPKLRFAEADARSVTKFFKLSKKSRSSQDRVELLLGKNATRINIEKALSEHLIKKANGQEDMAILYFAGHGFKDARQTYLACADTKLDSLRQTALSETVLRSYWKDVQAGNKVMILDACHSGGVKNFRGIGGVTVAPQRSAKAKSSEQLSIVMSSAGANQFSVEDENYGQGVFTVSLIQGLSGDADNNNDGKVSSEEIKDYLTVNVPKLAAAAGGKQNPEVKVYGSGSVFMTR
ncbi:MAG: caspase family protein [Planctomycetota bacterium]|nr:caspase family protein [Planctomycetota bacterium]